MAKVSKVERRAHALCGALARMTNGGRMQYRMARPIAITAAVDDAAADAAIAYAIQGLAHRRRRAAAQCLPHA